MGWSSAVPPSMPSQGPAAPPASTSGARPDPGRRWGYDADCDIGAVERGLVAIQAEIIEYHARLPERARAGPPSVATCGDGVQQSDRASLSEPPPSSSRWNGDEGARRIRFATGVTNIPPGGTRDCELTADPSGTRFVRATEKRSA